MSEPRHQCRTFCNNRTPAPKELSKAEFDAHHDAKTFIYGPFRETFGDGYGECYNPKRQAFGVLKNGDVVYCELTP